jgi:putative oxygen-independent coproporphyrinogen III oxidase
LAEDWQTGGFGLYLHWPFCEAKCPYCDFNSFVAREIDEAGWLSAYLSEIRRYAGLLPHRVLNTVYFGGGTPSLMPPDLVAEIIAEIRKSWPTANDLEITLEANPSSVEAGRFTAFRDAGVARISMGVQALNDADLRRLGRVHSVAEAYKAFDIAQNTFDRVSFDLIYARQGQTPDAWRAELTEALSLAADHLSLYQLTIEPGTAFGDRYARGTLRDLPDEDAGGDMYEITQELCDAAGFPAYEVSNHAKPGAESRHNLIYWRYGDYIGIGPGAHGRITLNGKRHATETWLQPQAWLDNAIKGTGEKIREEVAPQDQANEMLMMGLRTVEGIDLTRYEKLSGSPISETKLAELQNLGMIQRHGTRIIATARGRAVLNAVLKDLMLG